jgi:dCMP deaminase
MAEKSKRRPTRRRGKEAPAKRLDERPSWDEYFSRISLEVSKRSTCLRRHVGAILVLDKRILATGYNGAPRGVAHCIEVGCLRDAHNVPSGERHELCRGLHAEMNVLIQAASHGIRVQESTLYCTTFPCSLCAKMLINGGVQRIVAQADYADSLAKELLAEAGVRVELFDAEKHATAPFPGFRPGKGGKSRPSAKKSPFASRRNSSR